MEDKGEQQQQRKRREEVVAQGDGQREGLGLKGVGEMKGGLTGAYSGARYANLKWIPIAVWVYSNAPADARR